ncbi:MAG TPA: hypothetical protein VGM39_07430 [Kofleriaceae bacterium]|jgi:hypothetical protein
MYRATTVVALLAGAAAGCSTQCPTSGATASSRPSDGTERGDCVAPTGGPKGAGIGGCDPGLVCLSNLCVRPPPADCEVVANQLTSFDLGNYAEPEQRAPLVAKYKTACEKAFVNKEQGACMAHANDVFAAKQCAPLMFPELSSANNGSAATGTACAEAIASERAVLAKQLGGDPQSSTMLDASMSVMLQACEQDKWPATLVACMKDAKALDDFAGCNHLMPPDLQQKLTERVSAAAAKITGQPPPPPPPSL